MKTKEVHVSVRLLHEGATKHGLKAEEDGPLIDVLRSGAEVCGAALLPNPDAPLDRLHNLGKHDEAGPAIEDLEQLLGEYLKSKVTTKDFGIELVRAFRVNARWTVAPTAEMTPRQILTLFELNPAEYSLYRANSADLLSPDGPLSVSRGDAFEAQRDGKYGSPSYWS